MQEALSGKPAAASPDSCDHVLWFPQASARASLVAPCLAAECGKLCVGEIVLNHGAVPLPSFSFQRHQQVSVSAWGVAVKQLGKHREEAHSWLASHPTLSPKGRAERFWRQIRLPWFPPQWGTLRPYLPSSKRLRPTQHKACLQIFSLLPRNKRV